MKKGKEMFTKNKAVVSMCGNYCAFHEITFYVEWIFGETYYAEDNMPEYLCKKLKLDNDCDWDDDNPLLKQDKKVLDKMVEEYIKKHNRDYCDLQIKTVLEETDNNGNTIGLYLKI